MLVIGEQLPLPVELICEPLQMIPLQFDLRLAGLWSHEKLLQIKNEVLLGKLVPEEELLGVSGDVPVGLDGPNGR